MYLKKVYEKPSLLVKKFNIISRVNNISEPNILKQYGIDIGTTKLKN